MLKSCGKGEIELRWKRGDAVEVWGCGGSVGMRWKCGDAVEMRGCGGNVGMRWKCGAAMEVWGRGWKKRGVWELKMDFAGRAVG